MNEKTSGHHLVRVRMNKRVFCELQAVAGEETERIGEHVTVSDLIRAWVYDGLLVYRAVTELESQDFYTDDELEEVELEVEPVVIRLNPMLAHAR